MWCWSLAAGDTVAWFSVVHLSESRPHTCRVLRTWITHTFTVFSTRHFYDGSRRSRVFTDVCLSVCPFIRMTSQTLLKLRSPNLTKKCSTMSPWNAFILASKGQRSRSRGTEKCRHGSLHSCECWLLLVPDYKQQQLSIYSPKPPCQIYPMYIIYTWDIFDRAALEGHSTCAGVQKRGKFSTGKFQGLIWKLGP